MEEEQGEAAAADLRGSATSVQEEEDDEGDYDYDYDHEDANEYEGEAEAEDDGAHGGVGSTPVATRGGSSPDGPRSTSRARTWSSMRRRFGDARRWRFCVCAFVFGRFCCKIHFGNLLCPSHGGGGGARVVVVVA
eukprot:SAG11_NODE_5890_length_1440_cov_0.966443_1_plen_135_part_00